MLSEEQWKAEVDRVAAERDQSRELYAVLKGEYQQQAKIVSQLRALLDAANQGRREAEADLEKTRRVLQKVAGRAL